MDRTFALVLLAGGCGRIGFDPGESCDEPGLVAHYTFETADIGHDSGPGHHDATCSNGCPIQIGGRVGAGAAQYDGTACLVIADALALRPARFSIPLWATMDPALSGDLAARSYTGTTMIVT